MKLLKKFRNGALAVSAMSVMTPPVALAAGDEDLSNTVVRSIIDVITQIAFYIGIILLVWSIVMLVLALKNEDADSKSRAIMLIVVSIALVGISALIDPILDAAGFEG